MYNTVRWEPGAVVIHAADAKNATMLMRVVGHTRRGSVKTKYINPPIGMDYRDRRRLWLNDNKFLMDPAQFGIDTNGSK